VDSVLEQDHPAVELIVVDDGSQDATRDRVRAYGGDVRLATQENAGAAAARNHGMAMAAGEYLAFLDADDVWHPQRLSSQLTHFARDEELGIVFSDWQEWYPDSSGRWTRPERFGEPLESGRIDPEASGWLYTTLLLDCVIHTITVLIRSSVAREIGSMRVDLHNGEDYDYWLRVSRRYPIHKLDDVVALYRIREGSLARQAHERNYECEVVENAVNTWGLSSPDGSRLAQPLLERRLANIWFEYAYGHFHGGCPALAALGARRVIRHSPWRLDGWKYYFLSKIKQVLSPGESRRRAH
jgi:glycosyltransferase involved in cell wall biosynthesis